MASPPPSAPDPSGVVCPHCGETHPAAYTHCPKTGKALTSGRALVGRTIAGRYKIIGLLGEGGMGAVYIAEHTMIGRKVAIKRLHPELAGDEKSVQRFQREARAAASTGHEHIVEILDLGYAEDGAPYLVMEYLRGQSLAALLRKETRVPARRACEIVGQVLAALDAVHRQQIVHRDLKPDNVFLTRRQGNNDYVKILDFGISKMKRDEGDGFDLTRTGVMLGTPFYMSPEQARGMKNLDHRVDLYATGVILYECLTGRVPYEADNYHQLLQAILRSEPPSVRSIASDVDPALEAIVLKAISKDPAQRYSSAAAMLAALIPHGAHAPGPTDVIDSGEGPAMTMATALQATTPVSAELLERLDGLRGEERTPGHARSEPRGAEKGFDRSDDARAPTAIRAPGPVRPAPLPPSIASPSLERAPSIPHAPAHPPVPAHSLPVHSLPAHSLPAPSVLAPRPPRPPIPAPVAVTPPAPSPSGGAARYFFAASDDWDETRARAATDARPTPPFRDPISGLYTPPRESSAYGRDPESRPSGVAPSAAGASAAGSSAAGSSAVGSSAVGSSGGRDHDHSTREPSGPYSVSALSGSGSGSGSVREPSGPFVIGGGPISSGEWAARASAPGSDAEVKGSLVIAALDYLESSQGAASLGSVMGSPGASTMASIRALLDHEAQSRLSGVILPMAWLPLSLYDQLLRAAERTLGGGEGTTSAAIGRATADRELPTTHRLFMQTASPSAAAERIPQLYRLYHARGEARVSATAGAGVRVEIDSGAPESLAYAWALAGFWHRMLELTGAREVRVGVISCRGRGDAQTTITLRWR